MKARMRRLSVSIDSSSDFPHQQQHQQHQQPSPHHSPDVKSGDVQGGTGVTESRIDRVRKLLSSPLSRRKSASSTTSSSSLSFGSFSSSTSSTGNVKVFGTSLSILAHIDPPLNESNPSLASLKKPGIPYVITRLCNYIETHESGLTHEGLFRISANVKQVERLKHSFDESGNAPLEDIGDVASAAALVKLFLRELPEPVIPNHLHQPFFAAARDYTTHKRDGTERMRALVAVLPQENFHILKYLCSFLYQVTLHESQNRMNSSSLGIVFGPNIFRLSAEEYKDFSYANQVVDVFIREHAYVFDQEVLNTFRQDSLSSLLSRPSMPCSPPTKSRGSILGIKRKSSGPPTLLSLSHNHIIPILVLNNEALPPSMRAKAFPSSFSGQRQRRQSKLLGADIAGAFLPVRSHSEERPSPSDISPAEEFDIRRCSSTDEVTISPTNSASFFCPSIPEYESTSSEAKRNNSPVEEKESLCEVKVNIPQSPQEEEPESITRRANPDRKRRLSAIASCKMAQFQTDKWKCFDEDDVSIDDVNNNSNLGNGDQSPTVEADTKADDGDFDVSTTCLDTECLTIPLPSVGHRRSWPRESRGRDITESTSDIHLSSYPLSFSPIDSFRKSPGGHVTEAPVSPSAFRSYLSQRVKRLSDPTVAPSPPLEGEDFTLHQQLSKREAKRRIHSLKKSLKTFEVDFEGKIGRKPTVEDKSTSSVARPILLEILRLKRGLKDSFDASDDFSILRRPQPIILSPDGVKLDPKQLEETMKSLEESLRIRRNAANRPEELEDMTKEEIIEEKLDLQKALLRFESIHGRPDNKTERDIMRPLYDRYRCAKRALAKIHSSSKEQSLTDLQPILEHAVMSFTTSSSSKELSSLQDSCSLPIKHDCGQVKKTGDTHSQVIEQNFHELPLVDLMNHLQQSRVEKKHLRRIIKNFEVDFCKRLGRKVEKEDRTHLEPIYTNYKQVKGKLRLLEALVAKCEKGQYKI